MDTKKRMEKVRKDAEGGGDKNEICIISKPRSLPFGTVQKQYSYMRNILSKYRAFRGSTVSNRALCLQTGSRALTYIDSVHIKYCINFVLFLMVLFSRAKKNVLIAQLNYITQRKKNCSLTKRTYFIHQYQKMLLSCARIFFFLFIATMRAQLPHINGICV